MPHRKVLTVQTCDRLTCGMCQESSVKVAGVGGPQGYKEGVSKGNGQTGELAVQTFSWKPRIFTSINTTSSQEALQSQSNNERTKAFNQAHKTYKPVLGPDHLDISIRMNLFDQGKCPPLSCSNKMFQLFPFYSPWSKVKDFSIQQKCKHFTQFL